MAFERPINTNRNISTDRTMGETKKSNDSINQDPVLRESAMDQPQQTPISNQTVGEHSDIDYTTSHRSAKVVDMYGSPSIFNKNAIFVHPRSYSKNGFKRNKDLRGQEKPYSTEVPDVREVINSLQSDPKRALNYSDFYFSRFFRTMKMNRAMVLRRFPFPTYNNLSFALKNETSNQDIIKPLSKGVTFFGGETGNDVSDIIKIAGYKNYKELTADLDFIKGVDKGIDDAPLFQTGSRGVKGLKAFSALQNKGDLSGRQKDAVDRMIGKNWENDRRGPENVIHKTNLADVGVGANLEFKLRFEYDLRSVNNINPRIVMLDLISNLMTLVHTNAEFWGGQNIVLPNHQQFPFIGDEESFYSGNYGNYLSSVVDWFSEPFSSGGAFSGILDGIMSGDFSALGNLLGNAVSGAMDLQSSKSRSSVVGLKTLLDSSPIGNYHLTIGNPLDPWASIGNLICPSFELSFDDNLGHHNTPLRVILDVDLKTATPLDSTGVQGIFANGLIANRMYMKPEEFINAAGVTSFAGRNLSMDDIDRLNGVIF